MIINRHLTLMGASLLFLAGAVAEAATPISFTGANYTENFDSLPSSGEDPSFTGTGPFDVPSLAGWSFVKYTGNSSDALFRIGDGSANSGSLYNFGTTDASDRSLGALASGSGSYQFGATFVNDTGSALNSFTLAYAGEQWRYGGSGGDQTPFTFEYSFNAPSINSGTFFAASDLDLTPTVTTGLSGALDGNAAANRTAINGSASGFLWQPGDTLTLRWTDVNNSGSDDGLAVDDLTFSAAASAFNTLVWDQTGGTWNTSDANWTGDASVYSNGDLVQFTDANVGAVVIDGAGVSPLQVQVQNTTGTYSFTGGAMTGNGSLVKSGNGTLELGVITELATGITINGGVLATTATEILGIRFQSRSTTERCLILGQTLSNSARWLSTVAPYGRTVPAAVAVLGAEINLGVSPNGSFIEGLIATNGILPVFTVADGEADIDLMIDASIVGAGSIGLLWSRHDSSEWQQFRPFGGVTLNSGTLEIASNTGLGTGTMFFNGGTLRASTDLTGGNALSTSVSQGGDVTVDATDNAIEFTSFSASFGSADKTMTVLGNVTISGVILNGGAEGQFPSVLNKAGSGTLTLTEDNTYTGITTVQGGVLKLANGAAISATSSIRVDSGATFDLSDLVE